MISIFEYVEAKNSDGYCVAMYNENDEIVDKFVDPNDYPNSYLNDRGVIITGKYKNHYLGIHSGNI